MRLLLIDRILELERGTRAVGIKNVAMSEDVFTDHFPEQPIMPGALLAETLVQLADWVIREESNFQCVGQAVAFEKLKFLRLAQPGDQLRVEVAFVSRTDHEASVKGKIGCDDELIATGAFTMAIHPLLSEAAKVTYASQLRLLLGEGRRQHAPGRELW